MKKTIAIMLLSLFLIVSCNNQQFIYGNSLQEACEKKWIGCKVLNKNEDIGIVLFANEKYADSILYTTFYKNRKGYYLEKGRLSSGAISKDNNNATPIHHSNFIDRQGVQGEYIFGYVKDKKVNHVQIKYYSQKKGQEFTKHLKIVPVVNQTFLFYVNNNATNTFDEITPIK